MDTISQNKNTVTSFIDALFTKGDLGAVEYLAEDFVNHDPPLGGHRPASARYREILGPLGLGDELRATLIANKGCWGVLCLHREDASHGFDGREVGLIRRTSPHVAEGLRRAVTLGPTAAVRAGTGAPGIIVLDDDLAVMSMNPAAEQWLAEIDEADWPSRSELPMAVYASLRHYGQAKRLARRSENSERSQGREFDARRGWPVAFNSWPAMFDRTYFPDVVSTRWQL